MDLGTMTFLPALVVGLIMIPLNGLLLMWAAKIFKLADTSYKTAVKIAAILGVIGIILSAIQSYAPTTALYIGVLSFVLVSIVLAIYLIKSKYKLELGKAVLVWLVWLVLSIIAGVIIGLIIGLALAGVLIASAI